MSRKRDWRWVTRDEYSDALVTVWTHIRPVRCELDSLGMKVYRGGGEWVGICPKASASLGVRIRPGECRRVRITLEVLADE